jgi:phosphatidylglycerophosphate synthase
MVRSEDPTRLAAPLGPADWVTLIRAALTAGVAVLAFAALGGHALVVPAVTLAAVALALDGVDGWVARRTDTASARGARFDMEVDAALILALSIAAVPTVGVWVLAIGSARYGLVAAAALWPWLSAPMPARHWRKFVAAVQGVVLTVVIGDVLSPGGQRALAAAALALLAVSFGTQVRWLHRNRPVRVLGRIEKRPVGAMAAR